MADSKDSWDPDIPGPSKQQEETPTKQDKKSKKKRDKERKEKQSESVKTTKKKRKAEDAAGIDETEERKKTKQSKKIKKKKKCCSKKCLKHVNSQVQEKLNQEYTEQFNQSRESGDSYLRKYIYRDKKEKNSNGTQKAETYFYRIPGQVPFQEGERKIEICLKAFLKIFELTEWTLRRARTGFGKWLKSTFVPPVSELSLAF